MTHSIISSEALKLLVQLIKVARKERHMSQQELAVRLGVSRQTVIAIEKAEAGVAIGHVFEAAAIVGVPLFTVEPSQMQRWQSALTGFDGLLSARVSKKAIEVDDDF